jgi:metallopeptidase MepB
MAEKNKVVQLAALLAVGTITTVIARRTHKKYKNKQIRNNLGILLDWDLLPCEIEAACQDIISKWRELDDYIASQSANKATFASTFGAMIRLGAAVDPLENAITFPKHVSSDDETRDAAEAAEKKLSAFSVESSMRRDVYLVLKAVANNKKSGETLSSEEKRYVEKTIVGYEQNGMHLEAAAMKEVEELKKQISELEVNMGGM